MNKPDELPQKFSEIQANPPSGYIISEQLVDAVAIIDRLNGNIIARLGGLRKIRGEARVLFAPTNKHEWIADEKIIRPLPTNSASLFASRLGLADQENLTYSQAIELLRDENSGFLTTATESFLQAGRVAAESLQENIDIPGLNASLFPYQARGVRWMWETISHTGGVILADEMGLGKTLQIIALLLINPPNKESPALIICPTSLIANWTQELTRFSPGLTSIVHRGSGRTGTYKGLQKASVVITTYDTMVNDISIFSSLQWSWLICDEAQAIKNPDSNRRAAVSSIPRLHSIPMTGTPVENSLLDLWSLADFAIPGLLGPRHEFEEKYPDSIESAKAIGHFTDPIILRRRVIDVAKDLPDRIDIDVPIEMDECLSSHYWKVREETLERYPVAGALVATLQLQLVCAHPWLRRIDDTDVDGDNSVICRSNSHPLITPKMERAAEIISESFLTGRKVLVFSLFNRLGDLIKEACNGASGTYWNSINGSTPQEGRQQIIDSFTEHEGPACLILNPKAAGAGLNITAATVVIHFTPVWNPALELQASARAHRRGQSFPVTIYRLFYKDTVEEIMIERSRWKSDMANESIPISTRDHADIQSALRISPRH